MPIEAYIRDNSIPYDGVDGVAFLLRKGRGVECIFQFREESLVE